MKVLLSLACAAAIVAAPASAADLLGTAPPLSMPGSPGATFEIGTNWYVRGDLGISFDRAPSVSFSPSALSAVAAPYTIGSGSSWTTTDFTGGAGFGYRWNDWLRFDATWDYRNGPGGSRQATVVCPYYLQPSPNGAGFLYDTTNTCGASASVRQYDNAFLGNAYLDLGTYYGFTPYVGGGLGLNINTLTAGSTRRGNRSRRNPTSPLRRNTGIGRSARPPGRWPGRSRRGLATRSPPA
jgi:opacity protein-like surface antigen